MNKPNYFAVIPANVRYDKELSANAKLLYAEITALSNLEGFCWATNSYFAELYEMSTRNVSRLISQLNDKGYVQVEIINEFERKIYINKGYDKTVQPPETEMSGGQDKNVQPPHDKNVYKNNTSINTINNNKNNNKNNSSNSTELEREFEQLWKIYPRKMGKKKAFDSYKKVRKVKKIQYETIENGLYRYIEFLKSNGTETEFIAHFATWLNQERWNDDLTYVSPTTKKKTQSFLDLYESKYGVEANAGTRNSPIIEYDTGLLP